MTEFDEFEWFMKIANWEFDHLDSDETKEFDRCIWQAIAAKLMGLSE